MKFSTFRNGQSGVVAQIATEFGVGKRFMVAEMPTGTGKTFIAMVVKQILDVPAIYVCTTKSLQEQFLKDFPSAKLIKGRNNYPCGRLPNRFPDVSAEDCPADQCVASCVYAKAKEEARRSPLVVTNMAYFLNEIQGKKSVFGNRGYVVIDEADTLEDALLDHVSVQITQFDIEKMSLGAPTLKTKFEEWKIWAESALHKVKLKEQAVATELSQYEEEDKWHTAPIALIREARNLNRLAAKMAFFLKFVDEHWVWEVSDSYTKRNEKYFRWVFKPVRVDQFGDMIFAHGGKFLLMSATILDARQYEWNVGLAKYKEESLVGEIEVQSSFPKERRPIKILPGINLTKDNYEAGIQALPKAIEAILQRHPNEKGVIHAVTYRTAQELGRALPGRLLIHTAANRGEVINRFKLSTDPLVLVSPSVERGEDFPDDVCRFIVIVKLPYPYLGDPRVNKRLYSMRDGQRWYQLKTISKLVQMTGRGMRHEEDSCVSYILDPGFGRLFTSAETRSMFPKWWRESVSDETKGGKSAQGNQGFRQVESQARSSQGAGGGSGYNSSIRRGNGQGSDSSGSGGRQDVGSNPGELGVSIPALHDGSNDGRADPGRAEERPVRLAPDRGDREAEGSGDRTLSVQERFHGSNGWPKK